MVRVNNCCGCCDLKSGTIFISIVYLVLAIVNMALDIDGVVGTKGATMYIGIALDGVMVILCILLVIGAIKDNHILCMVWVVSVTVRFVVVTTMAVVLSVLAVIAYNAAQHIDPDPDPTVDPAAVAGEAVGAAVGVAIVALEVFLFIYSAIVVYSHAQNLREGGGGGPPPYSQFGAPKI